MDVAKIRLLAAGGESETVEFKSSTGELLPAARRRRERAPATGVGLADLDHKEILRTARLGIEALHGHALQPVEEQPLHRGSLLSPGPIEPWGRGTAKIVELCSRPGTRSPSSASRRERSGSASRSATTSPRTAWSSISTSGSVRSSRCSATVVIWRCARSWPAWIVRQHQPPCGTTSTTSSGLDWTDRIRGSRARGALAPRGGR